MAYTTVPLAKNYMRKHKVSTEAHWLCAEWAGSLSISALYCWRSKWLFRALDTDKLISMLAPIHKIWMFTYALHTWIQWYPQILWILHELSNHKRMRPNEENEKPLCLRFSFALLIIWCWFVCWNRWHDETFQGFIQVPCTTFVRWASELVWLSTFAVRCQVSMSIEPPVQNVWKSITHEKKEEFSAVGTWL